MRTKPTVLVIDDDPFFRKILEAVVPRMGLNIKTTSIAEQFMEYAKKLDPDLYIIDLQLTDITGFELIKSLRLSHPTAVIIVISGIREQTAMTHALELGANDFILKPLDRSILASKLSRYVRTESLEEHVSRSVDPPNALARARLTLKLEVSALDELGLVMNSRHLIPKGTVLKLKSAFLQELGLAQNELLVIIASNTFDSETGFYSSYAEFEDATPELLESLRRWIHRQGTKKMPN